MKKETETIQEGKIIKHTKHDDGRKDVHIEVNMLDVNENDPATQAAKKHIEDNIIPELANRVVTAVLLHKPTNISTSTKIKAPRVREWAKFAIGTLNAGVIKNPQESDFVIIEVDHKTGDAITTTLGKYGK